MIEYVEERLNIEFDWRLVPLADLAQQLALIIAAGGDMPDLFTATPQGITAQEMAQKGVVIPFQEMIDAGRMPLVKAKLAKPEYRGFLNEISHEGQIINLNTVTLKGPRQLKWVHYIRSDWYPELGITEDPNTVDDFADYLRAVVSGDPNGNGKADEIGWTNFMSAGFPRMWLTSFGINTFNHFPWTDINYGVEAGSEVYFAPTSDRYRAMIDWIGTMYREGLFDPDIFNVDSPKFNTRAVENTVGAINNWPVNGANLIGQLRQIDPDALYHILPDPTSSVWDGSDRVYSTWGTAFFTTYLAKAGKNIDAAVRAVDYMLGDTEFPITREMGIEGVHYEVADGLYKVIGTCEHCGNRPYAELASSERMTALGSPLGRLPGGGSQHHGLAADRYRTAVRGFSRVREAGPRQRLGPRRAHRLVAEPGRPGGRQHRSEGIRRLRRGDDREVHHRPGTDERLGRLRGTGQPHRRRADRSRAGREPGALRPQGEGHLLTGRPSSHRFPTTRGGAARSSPLVIAAQPPRTAAPTGRSAVNVIHVDIDDPIGTISAHLYGCLFSSCPYGMVEASSPDPQRRAASAPI